MPGNAPHAMAEKTHDDMRIPHMEQSPTFDVAGWR